MPFDLHRRTQELRFLDNQPPDQGMPLGIFGGKERSRVSMRVATVAELATIHF